MTVVASQGRLLARNTLLNLVGQVLPAVAAVVLLPYTLHGLGVARFGILSLAWTLLGYLSLFDLGLGRATVRFVSQALGARTPEVIPAVVGTSLVTQLISACVGGAALIAATPVLVPGVIKVPAGLVGDARTVLVLLGLALPVLICSSSLKGVLEAHQRFDLVNIVRSVSGTLIFAIPAAGLFAHQGLGGIMAGLDLSLVLTAAAYGALDLWVVPELRVALRVDLKLFRRLLFYGGWVTVSGLVVPVLVYADRLVLSIVRSVTVLAYYTVPYELVSRLQVIPWSFGTALFPALSARDSSTPEQVPALYARSLKFLLITISPLSLIAVVGASPILQLWLGQAFADRGVAVMQLLSVGMLLNSLAQVPALLLDAVGRPDLRAKVFLSYAPAYVGLVWLLIVNLGPVGAAGGWLLRSLLEVCVFYAMAWRLRNLGLQLVIRNRTLACLAVFVVFALIGALASGFVRGSVLLGLVLSVVLVGAYLAVIAMAILDRAERAQLWALLTEWGSGQRPALQAKA